MGSESESKLWGYLQTEGATKDTFEPMRHGLRLLHLRKLERRAHAGRLTAEAEAEQRQREDDMVTEFIAMLELWPRDI